MCEIADRIRSEGREEGILEGMTKAVIDLLEELGQVPQRIAEHIRAEDDLSVLSRWHRAAARATSIAEFEENM